MKILKYKILNETPCVIKMPLGARIISVQMQDNMPTLWAIVNENEREELRHFKVYGTGHEFSEAEQTYVATWQDHPYVWHLFEVAQGEDK